jgi:hypothetical protein
MGGELGGLIGTMDFAKKDPPETVKLPPLEKTLAENNPPIRVKLPVFVNVLARNEPPIRVKLPLFVNVLTENEPPVTWRVAVLPRVRLAKEPVLPESVTMKLTLGRSIKTASEGPGTPFDQFEERFQLPPCGLVQVSTIPGPGLKSVRASSHST